MLRVMFSRACDSSISNGQSKFSFSSCTQVLMLLCSLVAVCVSAFSNSFLHSHDSSISATNTVRRSGATAVKSVNPIHMYPVHNHDFRRYDVTDFSCRRNRGTRALKMRTKRRRCDGLLFVASSKKSSLVRGGRGCRVSGELFSTVKEEELSAKAASGASSDVREKPLSDLDADVLRSLLMDNPDIATEQNIKRLLKQNEEWKRSRAGQQAKQFSDETDDTKKIYSSKFLQDLTSESSWWKSLRAKTGAVLESVGLFVANKIERDINLLGALGEFFAERAMRDATRALKASSRAVLSLAEQREQQKDGSKDRQTFLLGGSRENNLSASGGSDDNLSASSNMGETDLYEVLNTPMDEIKMVSRRMQDIVNSRGLSGSSSDVSGNGRGLNTLLSGRASRSERSRRSYASQKRRKLAREKEPLTSTVGRFITNDVVDTAWQLSSEMSAEPAGYRTARVREQLSLAGAQTIGALTGGRLGDNMASLPVGKVPKHGDRLLEKGVSAEGTDSADTLTVTSAELMKDFSQCKRHLATNLRFCLEEPDQTWLTDDVVANDMEAEVDVEVLEQVITSMVITRDMLESEGEEDETDVMPDDMSVVQDFHQDAMRRMEIVRDSVAEIIFLAKDVVGKEAAGLLQNELLWDVDFISDDLEVFMPDVYVAKKGTSVNTGTVENNFKEMTASKEEDVELVIEDSQSMNGESYFREKTNDMNELNSVTEVVCDSPLELNGDSTPWSGKDARDDAVDAKAQYVTLNPEISETVSAELIEKSVSDIAVEAGDSFDTATRPSVMVEVVDEKDFDNANFKTAEATPMGDDALKQENALANLTLRSLDAFFFVAEKILVVGLPTVLRIGQLASARFEKEQQKGMGSKGWEVLGNVKGAAKRY